MKKNKNGDPAMPLSPDFQKLYRMKEHLRFSFVAYLYLHAIKVEGKEKEFNKFENVQQILEESILNIKLRQKIIRVVKRIIDLLPESETGYLW